MNVECLSPLSSFKTLFKSSSSMKPALIFSSSRTRASCMEKLGLSNASGYFWLQLPPASTVPVQTPVLPGLEDSFNKHSRNEGVASVGDIPPGPGGFSA